jgi:hypothetical protein
MAISEAFSGTETVSTTEHSLTTDTAGPDAETSDGVFQCFLDLNALAAGDEFLFRVYEKVLSSSTQRAVYSATFIGVQGQPNWVSPSLILLHGWDMTLDKIAGTDRSIDWSIRKVA